MWMNIETLLHIKRKRHTWNKYIATRMKEDFEEYKQVRNLTNEFVKNTKDNFEKLISRQVETDAKQFWRYDKKKTKSVSGVFNLKNKHGIFTSTYKEKADLLNDFFTTVFTKEKNLDTVPVVTEEDVKNNLEIIIISESDFLKLDINKSMGPDNINPFLLKSMADIFCETAINHFSKVLIIWNSAKCMERRKNNTNFQKESKSEPSKYRPVSLTSIVICKTLEKYVHKSILKHLLENNLLSDKQYGFRSGWSCALQLLNVLEKCSDYIEQNQSWDTIYLDKIKHLTRLHINVC